MNSDSTVNEIDELFADLKQTRPADDIDRMFSALRPSPVPGHIISESLRDPLKTRELLTTPLARARAELKERFDRRVHEEIEYEEWWKSGLGPKPNSLDYNPWEIVPPGEQAERLNLELEKRRRRGPRSKDLEEFAPLKGSVRRTMDNLRLRRAASAIEGGSASVRDFSTIADSIIEAEEYADKDLLEKAGDILLELPAYAIEFAATSGAFRAASATGKALAEKTASLIVQRAVRGAGYAAGTILQTASNPQIIAESASRKMVDELQLSADEEGTLKNVLSEEDDAFLSSVGPGALDAFIQVASERTGGLASKIPIPSRVRATKVAIVRRWLKTNPNATIDDLIQKTATAIGWNGIVGEVLEERIAEAGSAVLGLERWPQYASTDFWRGVLSEGIAFSVLPLGIHAAGRISHKERRLSKSELLTPSGAIALLNEMPDVADGILAKEHPSRGDVAGIPLQPTERLDHNERAMLARLLRESQTERIQTAEAGPEELQKPSTEKKKPRKPEIIDSKNLKVGEQLEIAGEPHTVSEKDGGRVVLRDSETRVIPEGLDVAIDQGSLKTGKGVISDAVQQGQKEEEEGQEKHGVLTPRVEARRQRPAPAAQASAQATKTETIAHTLIERLSNRFAVPIRIGKLRRSAAGIYKHLGRSAAPRVARLNPQFAGDYGVAVHEIAHHIDRLTNIRKAMPRHVRREVALLDYEPAKARVFEGFAEYLRNYATGERPVTRLAPKFHAWFWEEWIPRNLEIGNKINESRAEYEALVGGGLERQADEFVSEDGKPIGGFDPRGRFARAVQKFNSLWLDDQTPIKVLAAAANEIQALKEGEDPYTYAQVFTNSAGAMARDAIDNGVFDLLSQEKIGPGLRDSLAKLGDISANDLRRWIQFVAMRQAIDMWAIGKNPGIPLATARAFVAKYGTNPGWTEAADGFTAFHKALVKMLANAGRIGPQAESAVTQMFERYAPLQRVMEAEIGRIASLGAGAGNPIKRMSEKGSGRRVINPLLVTMRMTEQFYKAAQQAIVVRKIVDAAQSREGMGAFVERIPPDAVLRRFTLEQIEDQLNDLGISLDDPQKSAVINLWSAAKFHDGRQPWIVNYRDGQPEWYQLHPELHRALNTIAPYSLFPVLEGTRVVRLIHGATRLKRLGATELRASFGTLMNPIRDFVTHPIRTSGLSPAAPMRQLGAMLDQFSDLLSRWGRRRNPIMALYDRLGGPMSGFVGQDLERAYRQARDLMNSAGGRGWVNLAKRPLNTARNVLAFMEANPRVAEFKLVLKRHGYDRARLERGEVPPLSVLVEAMHASMVVTTNFRRAGMFGRLMNKVNAYQNAPIQDLVDDWRVISKHPARTIIRGIAWMTVPALAHWWLVKDEDWYEELPAWRRYSGWNFRTKGGTTLYVPSPFLLGMMFAHLPVAMVDSAYRKDPQRMEQWFGQMFREYVPSWDLVLPDVVEPALEAFVNYSFFRGKPIEPRGSEDVEKADRYYDWNTGASRYFGWLFNLSPSKLDHVIHGYTGGLGADVLRIPDEGIGRALGYGRLLRDTHRGESLDAFYDRLEETTQQRNSAAKRGVVSGGLETQFRVLDEVAGLLSDLRKVNRAIVDSELRGKRQTYETAVARAAMGRPATENYRNIFSDSTLPAELAAIRDAFLVSRARALASPRPRNPDDVPGWRQRIDTSTALLRMFGIQAHELRGAYRKELAASKQKAKTIVRELSRLSASLSAFSGRPAA